MNTKAKLSTLAAALGLSLMGAPALATTPPKPVLMAADSCNPAGRGCPCFTGTIAMPSGRNTAYAFAPGDFCLFSPDHVWEVEFQQDGNLVLYFMAVPSAPDVGWASGHENQGATGLYVQWDGNIVTWRGNTPLWSTGTSGHLGNTMTVTDGGAFGVWANTGQQLWGVEGA